MALKPQLSFSSGELDPILHDRVTLERFQNALATARNVMVGKSGTIMSRFGRFNFKKAAYDDTPIRIYCPPNSEVILEFGINPNTSLPYILLHSFDGTLLHTYSGDFGFVEADLPKLHFVTTGNYVYVFKGLRPLPDSNTRIPFVLEYVSPYYITQARGDDFVIPTGPTGLTYVIGGTGYAIDYSFTVVIDGEESTEYTVLNSTTAAKKPIAVTEKNTLTIKLFTSADADERTAYLESVNEVRVYQRPTEGAAFGFLGRTTNVYISGNDVLAKFTDVGSDADFANGLQTQLLGSDSGIMGIYDWGTGFAYQQRLVLANLTYVDQEMILASRPGYKNNFYRDFPYSADSALQFKAGTSGKAKVLRLADYNGMVVFTTVGVYLSRGALSPDNIVLEKLGGWVIDEDVPPLVIPGGLFFVEKSTGAIKQLIFSQELSAYDSIDQSIFSSHLFKKRTIKSWAFQDGLTPLVNVVFSDGTFATFTYNYEHQMKAWTRSDSVYPVEQVEGTSTADLSFFVVNKDGVRYIEGTVPRYISPSVYASNPEAHLLTYGAFMDSMHIKVDLLNDSLVGADEFILTPVVADTWDGNLTLTCGTSALFTDPGNGVVGTIFRFFNPKDKSKLDLEIVSRTNNNTVIVTPSEEFPEEYASGFRMYLTHTIVDGLDHLEGELVSVMADGDVLSSPYNDSNEEAPTYSVVQYGELDIGVFHNYRSAITVVGRPIVADVKTLNISTAEQSPTMIESLTVNKLYTRVHESRGLYVDNQFPEEKVGDVDGHSVLDMQPLDEYAVPNNMAIIGNRAKPPTSKRIETTLPGSWESNGQMAVRQVDPLHFEIMSIIADIEILKRSDR